MSTVIVGQTRSGWRCLADPPRLKGRNAMRLVSGPLRRSFRCDQLDSGSGRRRIVTGKPRSVRQAQFVQAAQLREQGQSWADVAAHFESAYHVNPRVALRQAHGWSQPQAADRWNARWPEDPKTFKNFSYWEQWPAPTGHAPSLDTLDRLAQLYECKIT